MNDETKEHAPIPYFVLESVMTHNSILLKRIMIILITVLVLWGLTIGGFIWYLNQPIEETTSVEVENADGNANYIGNDMNGDFNYGESTENNN